MSSALLVVGFLSLTLGNYTIYIYSYYDTGRKETFKIMLFL